MGNFIEIHLSIHCLKTEVYFQHSEIEELNDTNNVTFHKTNDKLQGAYKFTILASLLKKKRPIK